MFNYKRAQELIKTIISGGQTGVDQAGLLVATEMGIQVGGWCPLNGLDENNESILKKYPLKEISGLSFKKSIVERTKRNIEDSDGTLIVVQTTPLTKNITDGTSLTIKYVQKKQKPYLLIATTDEHAFVKIQDWIKQNQIKKLNVAGPRESSCKGIHDQACELFRQFFPSYKLRPIAQV